MSFSKTALNAALALHLRSPPSKAKKVFDLHCAATKMVSAFQPTSSTCFGACVPFLPFFFNMHHRCRVGMDHTAAWNWPANEKIQKPAASHWARQNIGNNFSLMMHQTYEMSLVNKNIDISLPVVQGLVDATE